MTFFVGISGHGMQPIFHPSNDTFELEALAKMPEEGGSIFFLANKFTKSILIYDGIIDTVLGEVPYVDGTECGGDCFCGGLSIDDTGTRLYALVVCPPYAYVYVFKIINDPLKHTFTLRLYNKFWIPVQTDDVILGVHVLPASIEHACQLPKINIGYVKKYSTNISGTGIVVWGGMVYVVTYREVSMKDIEEAAFTSHLSLLTVLNIESGSCLGHCVLGAESFRCTPHFVPSPDSLESPHDNVIHGIGVYDRNLIAGVAHDGTLTTVVPGSGTLYREIGRTYRSRGARELLLYPLADLTTSLFTGIDVPPSVLVTTKKLCFETLFDAMLPADFHVDQDSWKFYALYGNQIFVCDLLPYLITVKYGSSSVTGHLVDFPWLIEIDKGYKLECYFSNSTDYTLKEVELEITDDGTPMFSTVYLSDDSGVTLHKRIVLGDVLPTGSKEFQAIVVTTGISKQEFADCSLYDLFRFPLVATLKISK